MSYPARFARSSRRGVTAVHVIIAVAIVGAAGCMGMVLLAGILLPALGKARMTAMQLRDATQLRTLQQACSTWSADNRGRFPIPELADAANSTEAAGSDKNRSGSVLSLLLYQQMITPELVISPAERSRHIGVCPDYETQRPALALDPALAVYDPGFRGSPADVGAFTFRDTIGHNSYAHAPIAGARERRAWRDMFDSSAIVWGNRGPVYTGAPGQETLVPGPLGRSSESLDVFGRADWRGNIVRGDGHVEFLDTPVLYQQGPTGVYGDHLFVDETSEGDVAVRTNAFLRIWKRGLPLNGPLTDAHLDPSGGYVWVDGLP